MLEYFIERNRVDARLVEAGKELSTARSIADFFSVPIENIVKTGLFMLEGEKPVLAVFQASKKPSKAKINGFFGAGECEPASEAMALEITGYDADWLPPISIYGTSTAIDEGVFSLKEAVCMGGRKNTVLRIPPEQILEFGFEAKKADITV